MANFRLETILRHLQKGDGSAQMSFNPTAALYSTPSKTFRYTLDNPLLSWEQRQFYEDNGYILIPNLIDEQLLDECKQRFIDICNRRVDRGMMMVMKDVSLANTDAKGEFLINKIQDILWDDVLSKYILSPKILDYIECFTGPNIKAVHSMLINKPPDSGKLTSTHPLHQDLHYFPFRPADRIVAAWTAMEEVFVDNGCLFVLPRTHKGELHQHDYPNWKGGVNKAYHGVIGFDDHPKQMLPMKKGDTVFFHPLLIHGSGPNMTKGFRKAISCHYAASECYYIDVMGTTQENIALEIEEMAKKRGMPLKFQDSWRARSRLVRGIDHTL